MRSMSLPWLPAPRCAPLLIIYVKDPSTLETLETLETPRNANARRVSRVGWPATPRCTFPPFDPLLKAIPSPSPSSTLPPPLMPPTDFHPLNPSAVALFLFLIPPIRAQKSGFDPVSPCGGLVLRNQYSSVSV